MQERKITMKLFQYAILYHPTEEQRKNGATDKIVADVTTVLAKDQNSAMLVAARGIPDEYMGAPDQLEVAIRPF